MSMSVGASSNALSYLQSLLAQGSAAGVPGIGDLSGLLEGLSGAGASDPTVAPASTTGASGSSFDSGTMAALISLQGQSASGSGGPAGLFAALDTNGDGSISKTEFETALANDGVDTSSADALFAKLDTNGDGSISESELQQARHGGHHHHMHAGGSQSGGGQGGPASLLSATDATGATTQTTTNADGSTTTVVSYADGSTVEMTTPAASTNDSGSAGSGTGSQNATNLIEQLIQMQAQLLSTAASTVAAVA